MTRSRMKMVRQKAWEVRLLGGHILLGSLIRYEHVKNTVVYEMVTYLAQPRERNWLKNRSKIQTNKCLRGAFQVMILTHGNCNRESRLSVYPAWGNRLSEMSKRKSPPFTLFDHVQIIQQAKIHNHLQNYDLALSWKNLSLLQAKYMA